MPVINGVYLKDFTALPSSVTDANIIPIAITGNQIAYRTTVGGIVTDARVTSKILTGLTVTGGAIAATDTILAAFGKVQNQINSKVSSVGLTMPSAFNVANSPITSSGTLAVTAAGVASQYIRGDGALADFPTNGGGGSSVSYYLNGSVNQGTFVGNTYYEMNKTPVIGTGTDFTIGADGYIAQFITDANDPASLLIPAGNWNVEMYFSSSSSGGTPSFYVEVYKYNGTTFTLLGTSSATPEGITNGTAIDIYYTSVGIPETVLTITDRLAIRVYVTHSGRTITLHTEDNHLSEIITTFSNGINTLNGLTKQAQYFAVGSTGTDFAIVSSVDTHTFNIPDASATARGLITTGAQTIAGTKTFTTVNRTTFTNSDFLQAIFNNGASELQIGSASGESRITSSGSLIFITNFPTNSIANLTISSAGVATFAQAVTVTGQLTLGSTITNGTYTYTLPSATGTLALTSDIHSAVTLAAIGSTPNANAATLTGQVLNLEPASASFGGVVTTGTQTFAGDKTLTGTLYGIGLSMTGTVADIVQGTATSGKALRGTATTGWGLYASATTGVGVQGNSSGTGGSGVFGSSVNGYGGIFYNDSTTYPALEVNNNNESAGNIAVFRKAGTSVFIINSSGNISNGTYTYTLPSATGTLALTSALSGYLPLSAGPSFPLTGALSGTSATFSSTLAVGGSAIGRANGIRINGVSVTQTSNTYNAFISTTTTQAIDIGGSLGLGGEVGGDNAAFAVISGRKENSTSGNYAGYFAVSTIEGGASMSEKFRIASTGAATFTGPSGGNIINYTDAVNNTGHLYIRGGSIAGIGADNNFTIETAAVERMRITSGGEVYIAGTTDQGAYNLQVNGTGVWGAGAYVNGSDAKLKNSITPLSNSLELINKLNPVTYKYNEDWSKDQTIQTGFIAQDLQEILKDEVYLDGVVKDGGEYLSVAYQNLIPLLVKAIQELKAEIDLLKGIAPIEPEPIEEVIEVVEPIAETNNNLE